MTAFLRWHVEEWPAPGGATRRVRIAWLVSEAPNTEEAPPRLRYLAYLGERPRITREMANECEVLYPEIPFDWDALRADAESPPESAVDLSLEEIALHGIEIAATQGHGLDALDYRIGRGWRRPLSELRTLLSDPARVARFEHTSGSVMRYLVAYHTDYAYAVAKLRLILTNQVAALEELEREEPSPRDVRSRSERLRFWRDAVHRIGGDSSPA